MPVLLPCFILLCVYECAISSNYTIFYHRYPSQMSHATIQISSLAQSPAVDVMSFAISYSEILKPIVFVNGEVCDTKCAVSLLEGVFSTLTFDNDNDNLISFYQFYSTTTFLYYRECYQPMDYLKCRYRIGFDFELCICNNDVKKCSYDALLSWDEMWCTNQTIPTMITPQMMISTHGSGQPTETTRPYNGVESFSIFYRNRTLTEWADVIIAVNITIKYQAKDLVTADFDVCNEGDNIFVVNGQKCVNHCTLPTRIFYQITLDVDGDPENSIKMIGDNHNQTLIFYEKCLQPLNDVVCRSKAGLPWCICTGQQSKCIGDAQLATGPNCIIEPLSTTRPSTQSTTTQTTSSSSTTTELNTSDSSAVTTSSAFSMKTTSSSPTIPATISLMTTKTTSISSRRNSTLSATTTSASTSTTTSNTTFTTPAIVTTTGFESLKKLSESGVDLQNVTRVLNETLEYSEQRSDLSSEEIQQITAILEKSANLSGLQAEDSQKILLNMDCILSADESQIEASGNSSQILLGLLPTLVQNTNASDLDFLVGENLGFTSRLIDCSSLDTTGLIDLGTAFEILSDEIPVEDPNNSILLSTADICKDNKEASHMYLTIYRNRKLFNGQKRYNSYGTTTTLAQGRTSQPTVVAEDEVQNSEGDSPPSPCVRQIALAEASPVMSGTVISNDETILRLSSQKTMAVLKFNITDILQPLHGHFRVTWWDTELLEWSSDDQCKTSIEGDAIVARCEHLTDFTLIVDKRIADRSSNQDIVEISVGRSVFLLVEKRTSATTDSPLPALNMDVTLQDAALNDPNVCERALIGLGYSVNALSILSLTFLAFINLCGYWSTAIGNRVLHYLRGYAPPQRDFVSLFHKVSLLLFYVLFTIFSDQNVSGKACDVFASFSYILLMSSVLLTIFQALRLTTVFSAVGPYLRLIILPSSAVTISFLIPFIISILLLTLTNFFHRGDCFCWVRPDYIVYAVIIPTSFLILNAIFCTTIMCKRLFGSATLSRSVRHRDRIVSKIVAILIMQISLGMPWVLQYLTLFSPSTTAWHYIFTIIMGSQGTLMMMLFFYKRRQSMASYRRSHMNRSMNTKEEFSSN